MRSLCLILALACATALAAENPGNADTPLQDYLKRSDQFVELRGIIVGANGGSTDAEKWDRDLQKRYDAAVAQVGDNAAVRDALKEHLIKLRQCSTAGGMAQRQIDLCTQELAERRARVEVEAQEK